jgi:hypothetical protein
VGGARGGGGGLRVGRRIDGVVAAAWGAHGAAAAWGHTARRRTGGRAQEVASEFGFEVGVFATGGGLGEVGRAHEVGWALGSQPRETRPECRQSHGRGEATVVLPTIFFLLFTFFRSRDSQPPPGQILS